MSYRSSRVLAIAARASAARAVLPACTSRLQTASLSTIYDRRTPFEDINRHRSDAEQRIAQVPIVEVAGSIAVCDGGGGALGHPVEYIQLDTRKQNTPQTCKYCGIRYMMKVGYHGGH
ncbi:hypothetical protein CCR75_005237 [Bremia lactucae]|uniref:Zinc finger CHCC-type domain-containing protein n=1 Tax=Bremia lactucae TaxID=4779 RepID=A0A976FSA0_BRELC|nr:hypothetical protein CCR75_005237 [Bremia lactucae]